MAQSIRTPSSTAQAPAAIARPSDLLKALASARLAPVTLFAIALSVGAIVRFAAVGIGEGFPLNDGGMFLAMVDDLKANGYALPQTTSYNGADIPFAYPPLPFYLAAALSDLGGWQSLDMLVWLPLLFSLATVPAFWLLARSVLEKPLYASIATLVFAAIPRSYNWEVVGGGLTRAPGMFFATLALWQAIELFRTGKRSHLAPAAVLSALAVLSHIEMGWFVAFSTGFIVVWHRRQPGAVIHAALLAGGVAVLTAPWYVSVLAQSGLGPMLSAAQAGSHSPAMLFAPLLLRFTGDAWFSAALALGLLGMLASLRNRDYFLPIWLLVIFLLDPRKAATVSTLPLAMLAAIGLMQVVLPFLKRDSTGSAPGWAIAAIGFLLVIYAPLAAVMSRYAPDSPLFVLPEPQRQAMAWAAGNTPETATFAVMPSTAWPNDAASEWFPALAQRRSLATVQGAEWLGAATYDELQTAFEALAACGNDDAVCLERWRSVDDAYAFSHVFVPKGKSPEGRVLFSRSDVECCAALLDALRQSPSYTLVFENEGAAIFMRKASP